MLPCCVPLGSAWQTDLRLAEVGLREWQSGHLHSERYRGRAWLQANMLRCAAAVLVAGSCVLLHVGIHHALAVVQPPAPREDTRCSKHTSQALPSLFSCVVSRLDACKNARCNGLHADHDAYLPFDRRHNSISMSPLKYARYL
jgi:hypothetical protein